MKLRPSQTSFLICAVLCILLVGMVIAASAHAPVSKGASVNVATSVGGALSFTDQTGKPWSTAQLKTQYRLIFFGFTMCPDTCPMTMTKLTEALEEAGPKVAAQIQPIFVSVDPERDTPAALKEYLSHFYPGFVGLTGTQAQADDALARYKVYAQKAGTEKDQKNYTVNHSAYVYLMDPQDQLVTLYKPEDTAGMIAADLQKRFP